MYYIDLCNPHRCNYKNPLIWNKGNQGRIWLSNLTKNSFDNLGGNQDECKHLTLIPNYPLRTTNLNIPFSLLLPSLRITKYIY